ncbi:hypothetical protein [Actinomadura keratinilytica]|uniref:hypothetical protein n=1 Tax=Actinomadura keratinilytica TaxID=547461 RepID=UPI0036114771
MEFAGALRQAIRGSGLTLERIRHRLACRGVSVSVATLSYWQRGRSRPRSRPVVAALEEILQVPAGTLTGLLDDPPGPGSAAGRGAAGWGDRADRARAAADLWPDPELYARVVGQLDRSADHRLERLSAHDVYRLDAARRPARCRCARCCAREATTPTASCACTPSPPRRTRTGRRAQP